MLKISRDEYGDRAVNEAKKILNGLVRKKDRLKYRIAFVIVLAAALFLLILRLI